MENDNIEEATIYTLLEDWAGSGPSFSSQHGVSFLIESETTENSSRILFDVSQSWSPVHSNVETMGVDIGDVDAIFLSHCHYDHTGGLEGALEDISGEGVPVVAHPDIFRPHFKAEPSLRWIGMNESDRAMIDENGGKLLLTRSPFQLADGVLTTGEIEDRLEFERSKRTLYSIEDGEIKEDKMRDDVSLVLKFADGIVVVTGCAHAGIVGIVRKVMEITGMENVKAVVGGFHLMDAKDDRIERTVEELRNIGVDRIITGHCTGLKAECALMNEWQDQFEKLHPGLEMKFG